jgi:hypothetical protein
MSRPDTSLQICKSQDSGWDLELKPAARSGAFTRNGSHHPQRGRGSRPHQAFLVDFPALSNGDSETKGLFDPRSPSASIFLSRCIGSIDDQALRSVQQCLTTDPVDDQATAEASLIQNQYMRATFQLKRHLQDAELNRKLLSPSSRSILELILEAESRSGKLAAMQKPLANTRAELAL